MKVLKGQNHLPTVFYKKAEKTHDKVAAYKLTKKEFHQGVFLLIFAKLCRKPVDSYL